MDIGALFKIRAGVEGTDQVRRLNDELKKTEASGKGMSGVFSGMKSALLGAVSVGAVAAFFKSVKEGAMEAEQASNRLKATLTATGYSAGITKKELDALADSMALSTQFDDESIRNASAMFLKFGNIQKGVFEQGIKLSADLAALMGTDVVSAAQTVGKALSSPTEGLMALEKQTGKFSVSQKDAIEAMAKAGDLAGAQARVLEILKAKIGGTAEAMNTGLTKSTNDLKKAWDELLESLGKTRLISGDGSGKGGVTGWLVRELNELKKVIESGTWFERLKYITGYQGLENIMRLSMGMPAVSAVKPRVGATGEWGDDSEEEKAKAGAEAEKRRQAEEARAAAAKEYAKVQAEQYKQLRDEMEALLAKTGDQSKAEELLHRLQTKKYDHLSAAQKREFMRMAEIATYREQREQHEKEYQEGLEKIYADNAAAQRKEAEHLNDLVAKYKDLADPTAKFREQLEEIDRLWLAGKLNDDERFGARWNIEGEIRKLNEFGDTGKDVFADLKAAVEGWGRQASQTFVDWAFGAKGNIRDVAVTMLKEMAQMAVYKNIFQPFAKAGGEWLSTVLPGGFKFHSGGVVGAGGTPVALPASTWAGAPRMHGGGIAGLRSDEVPAILQKGETVLPRGAGGGVNFNVAVTVNQTGGAGEGQDPDAIANMVGNKVREVMVQESRPGGMLAGLRA